MKKYNCPKCDYEWVPRVEHPKRCPNCEFRLYSLGKAYDRMVMNKEMAKRDEERLSARK